MVSKIRCLDCKSGLTWAAQRQQFGRVVKRGHPPELAKQLMPRCGKCVTSLLKKSVAEILEWISDPLVRRLG